MTYFITLILPILQESHFNSAIIDVIVDFVLLGCFWSILILFCEFQHCCKDENSLFLSWQVNFSSLPCSFTPFMKLYSHMTGRRCKRKNLPMVESGKISPKNIVESSHNSANLGSRFFLEDLAKNGPKNCKNYQKWLKIPLAMNFASEWPLLG